MLGLQHYLLCYGRLMFCEMGLVFLGAQQQALPARLGFAGAQRRYLLIAERRYRCSLDWAAVSEAVSCRQLDRDMVVGGYRLPKGTPLIFSAYLLHHGPYNYTRAEDFWPERFEATPSDASADPREPTGMMYCTRSTFRLLTVMKYRQGWLCSNCLLLHAPAVWAVLQTSSPICLAQQPLSSRTKAILDQVCLPSGL